MIMLLNLGMFYLIGMLIYSFIAGRIFFFGGWKYRLGDKWMYYQGVLSYAFIFFILYTIKGLEESRLAGS